jgi:cytosine/adenosine deaminase-related metal-dependent hydrolase
MKGRPIQVGFERQQDRRNGAQYMENRKYFGTDVHQSSISAAVREDAGKLVIEGVIETHLHVPMTQSFGAERQLRLGQNLGR